MFLWVAMIHVCRDDERWYISYAPQMNDDDRFLVLCNAGYTTFVTPAISFPTTTGRFAHNFRKLLVHCYSTDVHRVFPLQRYRKIVEQPNG